MSAFLWHTIADMGGSWTQTDDLDRSDLYTAVFDYNYQQRHPTSNMDKNRFTTLWPRTSMISGDETANTYMIGNDNEETGGLFESWSTVFTGAARSWFLKGQVRDPSGNALAAARIEWFLTATDVYMGYCITDQNGFYSMPFVVGTGTVYGVANYANNTYIGATVNTLQPAL